MRGVIPEYTLQCPVNLLGAMSSCRALHKVAAVGCCYNNRP